MASRKNSHSPGKRLTNFKMRLLLAALTTSWTIVAHALSDKDCEANTTTLISCINVGSFADRAFFYGIANYSSLNSTTGQFEIKDNSSQVDVGKCPWNATSNNKPAINVTVRCDPDTFAYQIKAWKNASAFNMQLGHM